MRVEVIHFRQLPDVGENNRIAFVKKKIPFIFLSFPC